MIHPQPTTFLLLLTEPERGRARPHNPGALARILHSWKAQLLARQRTPASGPAAGPRGARTDATAIRLADERRLGAHAGRATRGGAAAGTATTGSGSGSSAGPDACVRRRPRAQRRAAS